MSNMYARKRDAIPLVAAVTLSILLGTMYAGLTQPVTIRTVTVEGCGGITTTFSPNIAEATVGPELNVTGSTLTCPQGWHAVTITETIP
jgi:hypothetical protein